MGKKKSLRKNVYILLDRSGSMQDRGWDNVLDSVNSYVKEVDQDSNVFIVAFDSSSDGLSYTVLRNCVACEMDKLTSDEVTPRGMTPLYDAAYRLFSRAIEDNAERTAIVVMTDGYENASVTYNLSHVKGQISTMKNKRWGVIFLGAEFRGVEGVAKGIGLGNNQWVNASAANLGATMSSAGLKTRAYFSTGGSACMDFNEQEQEEAAQGSKS